MRLTRRSILGGVPLLFGSGAGLARALSAPAAKLAATATPGIYRAAIIGHTGAGDYGHGYDQVFQGVDRVTVEGVADPDPAGRRKAVERSGARRAFSDYREMLEELKPDLVCIATRHPAGHRDMALAAIRVCRGIFIEKPFTETVADADAILAAGEARQVRIQVAHNRRYTSEFVQVKALLAEGFAGAIRSVRLQGKQDQRAGGEDLMVLGTHDFDLLRFYFGDPQWCSANVTQDGRDVTRHDAHRGREPILVAGDTIHALFGFANGLTAHWSSVRTADHWNTNFSKAEKWAFEILGTRRIIAYQSGIGFAAWDSPFILPQSNEEHRWTPLPQPGRWDWPEHARHPIRGLIHAIESGQPPICSGADGRWAIEMVAAIYESHRLQARVALPLVNRSNPLDQLPG